MLAPYPHARVRSRDADPLGTRPRRTGSADATRRGRPFGSLSIILLILIILVVLALLGFFGARGRGRA